MSNLLYLGLAAVVTAVGCSIIWLRQRKPTGVDYGIDAFRRELDALAPTRRERPEGYDDGYNDRPPQDGSTG